MLYAIWHTYMANTRAYSHVNCYKWLLELAHGAKMFMTFWQVQNALGSSRARRWVILLIYSVLDRWKVLGQGWCIWWYISLNSSAAPSEPTVAMKSYGTLVTQMVIQITLMLNTFVNRLLMVQCCKCSKIKLFINVDINKTYAFYLLQESYFTNNMINNLTEV